MYISRPQLCTNIHSEHEYYKNSQILIYINTYTLTKQKTKVKYETAEIL